MENNKPFDNNETHRNPSDGNVKDDSNRTKLKVKEVRPGRYGDNRVMKGILLLAVIVVGGFFLTWAFPREGVQKPLQQPEPPAESYGNTIEVITQRVNAVSGVEGSNAIVLSRVALIALEIQPDLSSAEIRRIKNDCENAVGAIPQVDEVLITANPGLGEELQKILQGDAPLDRLDYIYESIRDQHL